MCKRDTNVYVDIPSLAQVGKPDDGMMTHVTIFESPDAEKKALKFCQENFQADKYGRVQLLSGEFVTEPPDFETHFMNLAAIAKRMLICQYRDQEQRKQDMLLLAGLLDIADKEL